MASMDTRLVLVEKELERMAGMRKLLWSTLVLVLIQGAVAVYGFGRAIQKLESIDPSVIKTDISTIYDKQLSAIRDEQSRLTSSSDRLWEAYNGLRDVMAVKDRDTCTREEARQIRSEINSTVEQLQNRVLRLEDGALNNGNRKYSNGHY